MKLIEHTELNNWSLIKLPQFVKTAIYQITNEI